MRIAGMILCFGVLAGCGTLPFGSGGGVARRAALWIDLYDGEPVSYEQVLGDLRAVQVVYLGEHHTIARHHALQRRIFNDLAESGRPLALGLEQIESFHQPVLDRYNRGEIDFDQLARETDWADRWRNFEAYRPIVESARKSGAPVLALNARRETVRQVARVGAEKLEPDIRRELPPVMQLTDPPYEGLLNLQLMVHASASTESLRPMVQAQIARDETMAAALSAFLKSPEGHDRMAVVLCGAVHAAYGFGIPSRVRRRMPGIGDRIVLFSESGDLVLSEHEKEMARDVTISHEQLRRIGAPIADYLHAVERKP